MPLYPAEDADLPAVVDLVNAAYRGPGAAQGWTTEAGYIDGPRISLDLLRADLAARPDARLLVWRDAPQDGLLGCVWLEPAADGAWHLGMLTVRPDLQARRLGRRILAQAEAAAAQAGAERLRMTVVNIRDTLIAWYVRRGFALTAETRPFPYADNRFGKPRRDDLSFVVLEKGLA
ncbi:MAG: family N-acetyltransferase [Caulobacteraceae bacterium]|nr:family N-acetyltransferase [Caulobacteraceae bacterium]